MLRSNTNRYNERQLFGRSLEMWSLSEDIENINLFDIKVNYVIVIKLMKHYLNNIDK